MPPTQDYYRGEEAPHHAKPREKNANKIAFSVPLPQPANVNYDAKQVIFPTIAALN